MIISLSGTPGSGKTTVAKIIAKKLGLQFYSLGELVGKEAIKLGLKTQEFYRQDTITVDGKEISLDRYLDKLQEDLGSKEDNFIIDSRLGFHFIPGSIKIFIYADSLTGAQRIFHEKRKDEKVYQSVEETRKEIEERMKTEKRRYKGKYGIKDFHDPKNYDLFLNSSTMPIDTVVDVIIKKIKQKGF